MKHLICKTVFGSRLYGTQTATSDKDVKGIFLPTVEEVFLGRIPKNVQILENGIDGSLFSLHGFLHLAVQGQTVAIDMLYTPASQVERGPEAWVWDQITAHRSRFLSRSMSAFVGYARGQAAKYSLKGDRLNKLTAFYGVLERGVETAPLSSVWDKLPKDNVRTNPQGIREMQIAGKWYGESTAIMTVRYSVRNSLDRYGERARTAADAEGVDWKALSHAVRVSKELKELLTTGNLVFPLADRELLLRIKKGEIDLQEVQDLLDRDLLEIEVLTEKSSLPDKVDTKWWDQFLLDVMSEHV